MNISIRVILIRVFNDKSRRGLRGDLQKSLVRGQISAQIEIKHLEFGPQFRAEHNIKSVLEELNVFQSESRSVLFV